jgi:transcriptional regulator with XRE-family HTH domain
MAILARTLHKRWMKKPDYRKAYEELEPVFELADQLIEARRRAGLTQAQLAERMGTRQSVIARLESGRHPPSWRMLTRYAVATGNIGRFVLEPAARAKGRPRAQLASKPGPVKAKERRIARATRPAQKRTPSGAAKRGKSSGVHRRAA